MASPSINPVRITDTDWYSGADRFVSGVQYLYTYMKQRDDQITDDELTPLVFNDGKLIGWGSDALKRIPK